MLNSLEAQLFGHFLVSNFMESHADISPPQVHAPQFCSQRVSLTEKNREIHVESSSLPH
jgi:hypothetical protein